jgi:hypothetical protein
MNASAQWHSQTQHQQAKDAFREFLGQINRATGHSPTRMAREIGKAESTITRHWNGRSKSLPHMSTVVALANRYKIAPPPGFGAEGEMTQGFREPEVEPIEPPPDVKAELNPDQYVWRINTDALLLAGYLPGDECIIDMSLRDKVRDNDIVISTIEDMRGGADSVLRIYKKGWLFGAAAGAAIEPEYVDNKRVAIMAVVIKSWRTRD